MKKRLLSVMLTITMISAPMPSMVYAAEDGWVSEDENIEEETEEQSVDGFSSESESVEESTEETTELCPHGNDPSTCPECTGGTVIDTSFTWEFTCNSEKVNVGDIVTFTAKAVGSQEVNPADFGPIDIEHVDRDKLEYYASTSPDNFDTNEWIYTYSYIAKAPGTADISFMYHDENHSPHSLNAFVEIVQPEEIPGPTETEITITKQPENCFAGVGHEFSFSIEASGDDLHYEWFWFNGKRWIAVGEDADSYTGIAERKLNNSQYKCVVSNDTQEIESVTVQLLINEEFAIVSQPIDAGDILFGDTVRFEVEATGSDNIYYEWMQSKDGSTWDYIGCSDPVLEVVADLDSEGYYMCEISNDEGDELESDVVSFSLVKRDINILTGDDSEEAEEVSYYYGDGLFLYADVQEYEGIEYWYEWECNDGNGWYGRGCSGDYDVENGHRAAFSDDEAYDDINGRQYRLHVWDSQGEEVYSKTYVLKVTETSFDWLSHPAIGHVAESGNLEDGFSIDGYEETVSVNYEEPYELFVQFKPTLCWAAVSRANINYTWECNDGEGWYEYGSNGDNWSWENQNTQEENAVITSYLNRNAYDEDNGRQYRFHIWDDRGNNFYSEATTINVVKDELKIVEQPSASQEVDYNDQVTFTVQAEGTNVQYQWERYDEESGDWNRYFYNGWMHSEFWGNELTVHGNEEIDGAKFRCRIWDTQNQEIYSDEITLTVNKKELTILSQTETDNGILEVNYDEPIKIEVSVNRNDNISTWVEMEVDEGNGFESRWFNYEENDDTIRAWTDSFNAYPYLEGARFRFHIWDEQGYDFYSDEVTIKVVRQEMIITTQPENVQTDMFSEFTLKIAATGKNVNYQWQRSRDGENWEDGKYWYSENEEGTPDLTEPLNPDSMNYQYRCHIWDNQEQEIYSDVVTVTLNRDIEAIETGEYTSDINNYEFFQFTPSESGRYLAYSIGENMDATGSSSNTYAEIYNSNWELIDSVAGYENFVLCVDLMAGETYYIGVRYLDGSLSGAIKWALIPYADPAIYKQTDNIVITEGERTDLSVEASGVDLSYCWYYSRNGGTTWKPMSNDSSVSIRGTKFNNGYMYYCLVRDLLGHTASSNPILLTVSNSDLVVVTPDTDVLAIEGDTVTLKVGAAGTELSYEWYYSRNNGLTWRRAYRYEPEYTFDAALRQDGYLYYCNVVDEYGNEQSSDEITLHVEKERRQLGAAVVELESETYEYTGTLIIPDFTIKYDNKVLVENTDYEMTIGDECGQLGSNFVTLTGIGNYTGEIRIEFEVIEPKVSELTVTSDPYKMTYLCGDEFVSDGMCFGINYVNGAVRTGSAEELGIAFTSKLSVANPTVRAAYGDYYTDLTVTVSHNVVKDEAVNPTETENGLTEGSHCSGCGEVLVEQKEIPATGHSWDEGKITKAPTATTEGEKTYTCKICGETKVEKIPATGIKEGWQKNAIGWWYQNADGSYPKNQWKLIDGKWYHFNEGGYRQTGWLQLENIWYYLKSSGEMASDEWVENGKYYVDISGKYIPGKIKYTEGWKKNDIGWWYQNADGSYPKNQWKLIDGKWYHFNEGGYRQTGWLQLGNIWYYLKSSGEMASDEWVENGKYYVDISGKYIPGKIKYTEGWKKNDIGWWYQNADGSYPKSQWKEIDGKRYYFNGNGYRQTGWLQLGNTWYYLKDSGEMAADEWVDNNKYYVDANGKYIPGKKK